MADSPDMRAVFFFRGAKVAVISFEIARERLLERVRAGGAIPLPRALGIRATHLRIESGEEILFVMTVDHLLDGDGKLRDLRFDVFSATQ